MRHLHIRNGPARFAGLLLLLAAAAFPGCEKHTSSPVDGTQRVEINGRSFTLEIAADPPARLQGLSDRRQIADHGGMLFVFPTPDKLRFVMRRCYVPIDLIYLDATGRVIATHAMAVEPPDTPESRLKQYRSPWPAQFAIELKGGSLQGLDLTTGQKINLPLEDLKQLAR